MPSYSRLSVFVSLTVVDDDDVDADQRGALYLFMLMIIFVLYFRSW